MAIIPREMKETVRGVPRKRLYQWLKFYLLILPFSLVPLLYFHYIYGMKYSQVIGIGLFIFVYWAVRKIVLSFKKILFPNEIKK